VDSKYKFPSVLIVGAGFYGAVCARELTDAGYCVQVIEKRPHLGGNCYTRPIPGGIGHEHVYGPHIFHTNSKSIWDYVSRFTAWVPYVHRPKARFKGRLYTLPFNLSTLCEVYETADPLLAKERFENARGAYPGGEDLEAWCLSQIGPDLYERLVRGYTRKQWQKDPQELPASIIRRIPIRWSVDDNYFNDAYQGIPEGGYTAVFEQLLAGIPVMTGVDFLVEKEDWMRRFDLTLYSGPLDSFFDYCFGPLEYRSLRFESRMIPLPDFQGVSQINETSESVEYTRVIEHRHFYRQAPGSHTLVTYEYPDRWVPGKEEYYPIETEANRRRHQAYCEKLASERLPLHVGGRLGTYRYYDMHQVIAMALKDSEAIIRKWNHP
jgi:UDP-galactopyranose mutase